MEYPRNSLVETHTHIFGKEGYFHKLLYESYVTFVQYNHVASGKLLVL